MQKIPKKIYLLVNASSSIYQLFYYQTLGENGIPAVFAFSSEERAKRWIAQFDRPFELWDIQTRFAIFILRKITDIKIMIFDPEPNEMDFPPDKVIRLSPMPQQSLYQFSHFNPLGWTLTNQSENQTR